jgi:dihydroorotase-like cyclic amidohydrolase
LWPRKGLLAPGADADIILVDPTTPRTLHNADVLSKAGWTPFGGRSLTGRVVQTYLRGHLVAEEGKPADVRSGRFIAGVGHRGP